MYKCLNCQVMLVEGEIVEEDGEKKCPYCGAPDIQEVEDDVEIVSE